MKPEARANSARRLPARRRWRSVRAGGGKLLSPNRKNGVPESLQAAKPSHAVAEPQPIMKMTASKRPRRSAGTMPGLNMRRNGRGESKCEKLRKK